MISRGKSTTLQDYEYYRTNHGILYYGNALDILPLIKPATIPLIITDPPFSVGTTSNALKGDWNDNNLIQPFFNILFRQFRRILKPDGECYINTDWRTLPLIYPEAIKSLIIKNCIVWDYEWIKAGTHYRFSHEFILYALRDGKTPRKFSASERDVWRIPPINYTDLKNKHHQTQKPLPLIEKCVKNSLLPGSGPVLDCFFGSGTTGVYCEREGISWVGVEINEKMCEIAIKRLEEWNGQTHLKRWGAAAATAVPLSLPPIPEPSLPPVREGARTAAWAPSPVITSGALNSPPDWKKSGGMG